MKKVKLLTSRAGPRSSANAGDEIEVSNDEARRMIEAGQAVPVTGRSKRTATKAPPETRSAEAETSAVASEDTPDE